MTTSPIQPPSSQKASIWVRASRASRNPIWIVLAAAAVWLFGYFVWPKFELGSEAPWWVNLIHLALLISWIVAFVWAARSETTYPRERQFARAVFISAVALVLLSGILPAVASGDSSNTASGGAADTTTTTAAPATDPAPGREFCPGGIGDWLRFDASELTDPFALTPAIPKERVLMDDAYWGEDGYACGKLQVLVGLAEAINPEKIFGQSLTGENLATVADWVQYLRDNRDARESFALATYTEWKKLAIKLSVDHETFGGSIYRLAPANDTVLVYDLYAVPADGLVVTTFEYPLTEGSGGLVDRYLGLETGWWFSEQAAGMVASEGELEDNPEFDLGGDDVVAAPEEDKKSDSSEKSDKGEADKSGEKDDGEPSTGDDGDGGEDGDQGGDGGSGGDDAGDCGGDCGEGGDDGDDGCDGDCGPPPTDPPCHECTSTTSTTQPPTTTTTSTTQPPTTTTTSTTQPPTTTTTSTTQPPTTTTTAPPSNDAGGACYDYNVERSYYEAWGSSTGDGVSISYSPAKRVYVEDVGTNGTTINVIFNWSGGSETVPVNIPGPCGKTQGPPPPPP